MRAHLDISTSLGVLQLIEDDGRLLRILLPSAHAPETVIGEHRETPVLKEAHRQVVAFLEGQLTVFSLPLAPCGTPFQQQVRRALLTIPYGHTARYGELAKQIGSPKAARAVGLACRNNPLPFIVPCHRVVAADGGLVGYNGGLNIKRWLLALEQGVRASFIPPSHAL